MNDATQTPPLMPALLIFTRLFAALTQHGVTMLRCSEILAEDAPAPYDDIARRLRASLEENLTLTQCFRKSPELFPPFYLAMIHAGEVGGIIHEFFGYLAELLSEQWKLRQSHRTGFLPLTPGATPPENWAALSGDVRMMTLVLCCRSLSMLLAARVPRRIALETIADLLPAAERFALLRLAADMQGNHLVDVLQPLGIFPTTARQLMAFGEETGELDLVLEKIAQLYHDILRDNRQGTARCLPPAPEEWDAGTHRESLPPVPLGKLLLDQHKITRDQLRQALTLQKSTSQRLGELLIGLGFVNEQDVLAAFAQQWNIPRYDPQRTPPDPTVLKVIPEDMLQQYNLIPLCRHGSRLVVALGYPAHVSALDDLRLVTGFEIEPVLATDNELNAIRQSYGLRTVQTQCSSADGACDIDSMLEAIRGKEAVVMETPGDSSENAPIIRMVNVLIENARKQDASEIYIELEAQKRQVCVRYRINNMLHEVMTLPTFAHVPIVARLKVMADIDPRAELPQYGDIRVMLDQAEFTLRLDISQGAYGALVHITLQPQDDADGKTERE
jgi:hypothetical protein